MRIEGQLKDHIVFPPGNTISSEPASHPARQRQWRQAYQGRLQTSMEIVLARNTHAGSADANAHMTHQKNALVT